MTLQLSHGKGTKNPMVYAVLRVGQLRLFHSFLRGQLTLSVPQLQHFAVSMPSILPVFTDEQLCRADNWRTEQELQRLNNMQEGEGDLP